MSPIWEAITNLCWTLVAMAGWMHVRNFELQEGTDNKATFILLLLIGIGVGWNFADLVKVL